MPKRKKRIHLAKKEQAALEYLVTYGWAILVVLVAIAGLAYFGVFSSDKFIPSKCILPPGISCLDFKVENDKLTGNGKITLRVQNSLGEDISINSVAAANCGTLTTSVNLLNGEAITLYVDCNAPISKSKYNEQINITYASMFSGITHTLKGDLVSIVTGEIQQVNASPDITPPILSNGAPTGTLAAGTTQATLSLTTNEAATCKYGTVSGQSYTSMTNTFTTTGATSHSTQISGLSNGTSYTRYVRCQDQSNNANINDYTISFSVANGTISDTTPPTVSITSPINLATVSGTISVTATASDNIAVAGVQFKLDSINLSTEDTTSPYSISWNTSTSADGFHILTATARDTSNNLATSSQITVNVSNAAPPQDTTPPTTPTELTATAASSSQIDLAWTASTDNVGVAGYRIYRCQGAGCTPTVQITNTTGTAYSNTGLTASTNYTYQVGAYDSAVPPNPSALSASVQGTTLATIAPVFQDDFESGNLATPTHADAGYAWTTTDGNDAIAGIGANGSFTRTSGVWSTSDWVGDLTGQVVYLQSVPGNANGDAGLMGPYTITSYTTTRLDFVGDATGAVQTRTHHAFISSARAYGGTKSVKLIFGPNQPGQASRSQLPFDLPLSGLPELWLEYYLYIPSNYVHRAPGNNKFAGIFFRQQVVDASRILFDFETDPNGSGGSITFAQSVYSDGDISTQANHVFGDTGYEGTNYIGGSGPAVLGGWNQFRVHIKSETADGASNGVMELWVNGTIVFRATSRRFGYPAAPGSLWYGTYPAVVDRGYLLGASNSGFAALTEFYIDDVKLYATNPGW